MSGLFGLLFFATIILFIVGMLSPALISKYYKKPVTRKQIAIFCLLAGFIFMILIGVYAPKTSTNGDTGKKEAAKLYDVVKVVDGDTIDVNIDWKTERIRLIGLDTPEIVDPRTTVQCFGQESSTKAHELLDGKKVALETDATQGERDKYDRLLRYVFIENNTDFSKSMIENGFGHEYTYEIPYKRQVAYKEAQKQAESGKKGLWADTTCAGTTTRQ